VRHVDPQRHRFVFATGVALVAVNVPVGWIGLLVCAALAAEERDPRWVWAGVAVYAFSWVLLGLGVLITGERGMARTREILRLRRRGRRLRELLHLRRLRRKADSENPVT
jgi:hypothetical protein